MSKPNNIPEVAPAAATPTSPETAPRDAAGSTPQPTASEAVPAAPEVEDKGKGGNAEAAKFRVRLREAEQERDTAQSTVETLRKQLVAGAMPAMSRLGVEALWSTGKTAEQFFGAEDGQLDVEALTTAVQEAHETLGVHYGPDPIPQAGTGSGEGPTAPTWSDALKKRK